MPKKLPDVSEAEWEVLDVLWSANQGAVPHIQAPAPASLTAAQVIERVNARGRDWAPQTVKTLLARLVRKAAIAADTSSTGPGAGKAYLYHAIVRREDLVRAESESFLSRMFGSRTAVSMMLAHLITPPSASGRTDGVGGAAGAGGAGSKFGGVGSSLTREEIEACRRLLDEADRRAAASERPTGEVQP